MKNLLSLLALAGFSAVAYAQPVVFEAASFAGEVIDLDLNADGQDEHIIISDLDLGAYDLGEGFILPGYVLVGGPSSAALAPVVGGKNDEASLNKATLTIPAGTILRGQPGNPAAPVGEKVPGALIVTIAGTIVAEGSESDPIIMTTAAVATPAAPTTVLTSGSGATLRPRRWTGNPGEQFLDLDPKNSPLGNTVTFNGATVTATNLWGGLVVCGQAPTNSVQSSADVAGFYDSYNFGGTAAWTATNVGGRDFVEGVEGPVNYGISVIYGGEFPNDNSGVISYVSIRHAGAEVVEGSEINGLSLGGVGYATQIDHVEVYGNADDGVEIFGGSVFAKYLLISNTRDDGLDIDQGYTGTIQFVAVIDGPAGAIGAPLPAPGSVNANHGDNGFELDGNDKVFADGGAVSADFRPLGFTQVYNFTIIGTGDEAGSAIRARREHFGLYANGIIYGWNDGNANIIRANEEYNSAAGTVGGFTTGEFPAWARKLDFVGITIEDSNTNTVTLASFATNTEFRSVLGASDTGITEPVTYAVGGINPRPLQAGQGGSAVNVNAANANFGGTGFLNDVSYRGAFTTSGIENLWTTGWTALNTLGILVD